MTALLSLDSKNFTLACNRCGQLVTNLAPTMGDWAVAWSLFSQDGWTGDDLATGPHTCGRCTRTSPPPRMVEQALTRERTTPATVTVRGAVEHATITPLCDTINHVVEQHRPHTCTSTCNSSPTSTPPR